jgi:transposase-like protein
MDCVGCGSAAVSERSECTAQGYRRFRCRGCGKQFNERSAGSLNRTQYPSDVIALVVLWRLRYKLALRDLPEMFLVRGIVFGHETVPDWETKLTPALAESLRRRRHGKAGRSWYVHETCIKVHGHWRYLYRAIDRSSALVDVMLSEHCDMTAAKAFFESAKMVTGVTPDRVTTDGHDSFRVRSGRPWAQVCGIATASISITGWSKIIAASKAAMVRCEGSNAQTQPGASAGPTMSCATFSVPAPEPTSMSPLTTEGFTSFGKPQQLSGYCKPPERVRPSSTRLYLLAQVLTEPSRSHPRCTSA